ncbi:MAG TPA: hypothetical protein VJC11_02455 [Patescibacteria group bacterium]|nr:hypothetical protein [Patescibacteria group bacterium]
MIIRIRKKHLRKINPLLVGILAVEFLFPQHTLFAKAHVAAPADFVFAQDAQVERVNQPEVVLGAEEAGNLSDRIQFPKAADRKVLRSLRVTATAYSSTRDQTDASPFISASGVHVFDGMVAANFLRFGTKIRIPDYYGDKQFVVLDRMNPRFSSRVDVWMDSRGKAKQFGVRHVRIEVLE